MATETTIVREAPFVEEARKDLLTSAEALAGVPVTIPQVQVAPTSSTTTQAYDLAQTGIGGYQPYLTEAAGQLGSAATGLTSMQGILDALKERGTPLLDEATTAARAGAGDITSRIAAFQDPYQQQVIDTFSQEADRQAQMAQGRAQDAAIQRGAFGGGGGLLQGAEIERNLADVKQRNMAGLMSQGYGQALGAAEREAGRMQALPGQLMGIEQLQYGLPTGLAGSYLAGVGGAQNLSGAYGGLGSLAQQLPAQDVALLSQIGAQQQQQAQQALDIYRQNQMSQLYEPYQRVGWMGDILKGQPSTTSTLTSSTDPRANPLSQMLGGGISLAGIFGPQGYGSGYLFQNPSLAGKVPT